MKLVPTGRFAVLMTLPLALGVVTPFVPAFVPWMFGLDAALLVFALADAASLWRIPLTLFRRAPTVFSLGRDNPIHIEVASSSRRHLQVWLKDDAPDTMSAAPVIAVSLPPFGRREVSYNLCPSRRGSYDLGSQHARYASRLGLWQRQVTVVRRDPVRVYPDVRAVRIYELLARQNREAVLAHAARLRGGENDFERLREHLRDDPYRSIDWKATARRQKLTVRSYQKERDQSVVCLLDCGRLMTAESDGLSYFDHALNASLMLAHVAARSGDQVGMLAFDHKLRAYCAPTSGPKATQKLIAAAYDLLPALLETDFGVAIEVLLQRVKKRALVILFTQVQDDQSADTLVKHLRALPKRHLPLCVLLRDDEVQAMADAPLPPGRADLQDPGFYQQAAAAEATMWKDRLVGRLKASGVLTLSVSPRQLTPTVVNRYLEIKARQQL